MGKGWLMGGNGQGFHFPGRVQQHLSVIQERIEKTLAHRAFGTAARAVIFQRFPGNNWQWPHGIIHFRR
ncbi:MAG TPA: hypothetical protein PKY22_02440 [Accumulibacter sp.]|nr:hypothetical protein [Accumulibacter sp.]